MPLSILCNAVKRLGRAMCVIGLFTFIAPEASAQLTLRPVSFELGVGVVSGTRSAPSKASTGPIASALFAWRVDSLGGGAVLTAVMASTQASIGGGDVCVIIPTGCAENFPNLHVFAVLGGWGVQSRKGGAALRAMLGPALVRAGQESAFGLQSRVDLSSAALGRVSLVGWLQFLLMPDLLDERARTQAFGIGLRVQ